MGRMLSILTTLYRRWKYVEDTAEAPRARTPVGEQERLKAEVERGRAMVAHFRRHGCEELASAREASVRSLEQRLRLLGWSRAQ